MPIYMRVAGIDGESRSPEFAGAFDVFASSWGVTREVAGIKGGGGGNVAPDLSDISIAKPASKGSPKLHLACCSGQNIPEVEFIYTEGTTGAEKTYLVIKMERVVISSYSSGGDGGDVPTESISLNYAKITWSYQARDGSSETVHWDKATNSGG